MKIISIINQKGGVAKTTTSVNLASYLSRKKRVLLIDADKQGNLSSNLGVEVTENCNVYNLFTKQVVQPKEINKRLFVIPANEEMAGVDFKIQSELARELILQKALESFQDKYDYCIIDCPPDINLVTVNALSASNGLIIPVNLDYFGFKGINAMVDYIVQLRQAINPSLSIYGILITSYNDRLKVSKEILSSFKEEKYDVALFKTKIRINTAIPQSQLEKKSIFDYDKTSNGAIDYEAFGKEMASILNKK